MRILYTFILLAFSISIINLTAQQPENSDSLLIKRYWNKVFPKSVTSLKNYLYNGIDNYLQMVYPDEASMGYGYHITTNNGMVFTVDDGYLTIPQSAGRSFFTIYLVTSKHDTLMIGKKQFIVQNVPIPTLKIGNYVISENTVIDKSVFFAGEPLKLYFTDDIPESTEWYNIQNFSLGYSYGSIYLSVDNNGSDIEDETRKFISKIGIGRAIFIKVNTISPTGILRFLPIVKFKFSN